MISNKVKEAREAFALQVLQAMWVLRASRGRRGDARDRMMVLLFEGDDPIRSLKEVVGELRKISPFK